MDASAAYVDTSLRNIRGHMRQGSVCGGASFELGRRDDDADQLARVVGHLHELEAEERCFVWPGFISHSATLLPKSLYTAGPACMMARTEPSSTSCSRAGTSVNRLGRSLCSRGRVGGGVVVGGSGFVRRYARAASTVASCIEMRLATKARLLPACFDERSARQAAIVALLLPLPRASHACSARSQRPPRDCRSSRSCARRPR